MKGIKPILIIGIPSIDGINFAEQVMKQINSMEELNKDYHILSYSSTEPDFVFKVFYEKDIVEVQLDELKEILKKLK